MRGGDVSGSGHRMTHHDHIHIVGHYLDGVLQGLTLSLAGVAVVRKTDNPGSKPVDGGLERKPRPGGRLEKQAGDDLAGQETPLPILLEQGGHVQDMEYFLLAEILD